MRDIILGPSVLLVLIPIDLLLLALTTLNLGSLTSESTAHLKIVIAFVVGFVGLLGVGSVRHYRFVETVLLCADGLAAINLALIGSRKYIKDAARIQAETGQRVEPPRRIIWRIAIIGLMAIGVLIVLEDILIANF